MTGKRRRRRITLHPGDEVIVNGFHVRAVGSGHKADSLQLYRPEAGFNEHGENEWRMLYAGMADEVLCKNSINVGEAANLAASDTGWLKAIATAKTAVASQ